MARELPEPLTAAPLSWSEARAGFEGDAGVVGVGGPIAVTVRDSRRSPPSPVSMSAVPPTRYPAAQAWPWQPGAVEDAELVAMFVAGGSARDLPIAG
ncbi:hypothetical protein ABZ927_18800 [Streptomyces massasporeus]